jgi:hypothetical protein
MTAQVPERLFYAGETLPLFGNPLFGYLEQHAKFDLFQSTCTANWRGYVGSWAITEERLYLTNLVGRLRDGTPADLQTVFPESMGSVFADWYSGSLRVPQGKLLDYVHLGYASRYERDLLIEIHAGCVLSTTVRGEFLAGGDSPAQESCSEMAGTRPGLVKRLSSILSRS